MSEERQKIQLRLAFPEENEGEAFKDSSEGTAALAAKTNSNDPVKLVNLYLTRFRMRQLEPVS